MDMDEYTCLYRVRKTVFELLRHRGYTVSDNSYSQVFDDFKKNFNGSRESLNMLFQKSDCPDPSQDTSTTDAFASSEQKILVFYPSEEKVGSNVIKQIATKMCELNVLQAIVILKGATTIARRELDSLHPCHIELFNQEELMVNITEHDLVPKHEVLAPDQKIDLLKKYRVKEHQLPKIQIEDPIARYFGMRKGQIMKITRASETAGRYITYRMAF